MERKITTDQEKQNTGIRILSSNALKVIACICMLIDNVGLVLMYNKWYMRAVGRLAFPIFAFLIVQGAAHTSNIRKYILRLAVFALISEIPFDLAIHDRLWYLGAQNIFFTLTAGLFVIYCMESRGPLGRWRGEIALATALLADILRFVYGMAGVGVIVGFYWCDKDSRAELPTGAASAVKLSYFSLRQNIEVVIISALTYILCLGMRQLYALLAFIPINMYNGERGRWNLKYVFYMFYPAHLLIIWFIWIIWKK